MQGQYESLNAMFAQPAYVHDKLMSVKCLHRLQFANYSVSRPHGEQGRYMSIPHHHRGEVQFLGRLVFVHSSFTQSHMPFG